MHDELRYSMRKALMQDNAQRDGHVPQQRQRDRAADPPLGELPARHRPRRRGGALERPDLPLPGHRLSACARAPPSATARTSFDADLTDPGLGRDRGGARAALTTASNTCSAPAARPATSRARRSPAAIRSRTRARATIRRRRRRSRTARRCSARPPRASATTRSRSLRRNLSQPYTNPEGHDAQHLHVLRLSASASAASTTRSRRRRPILLPVLLKDPNFTLRTQCQVLRINLDDAKKQATGVTYVDAARARVRAAGQARHRRHVRAQQRAHAAALRHRHAVRSGDRQGRGRPQLRLPDDERRAGVLRRERQHQSVHALGRERHRDRRFRQRQLRSRSARLRRRRLHRRGR